VPVAAAVMTVRAAAVVICGIVGAGTEKESATEQQENEFPFRAVAPAVATFRPTAEKFRRHQTRIVTTWPAINAFIHSFPFRSDPEAMKLSNACNGCEILSVSGLADRSPKLFCNQTTPPLVQPERNGHCLEHLLRGFCVRDVVSGNVAK
jgi:hypothetical protein